MARLEGTTGTPRACDGEKRAVGLPQTEHGRLNPQERQDGFGDPSGRRREVQALGQEACDPGQFFRLAASACRLGIEASVLKRQRRVVRKRLSEGELLIIERPARSIGDHDCANHSILYDQRHREQGAIHDRLQLRRPLGRKGQLRLDEEILDHRRTALADRPGRDVVGRRDEGRLHFRRSRFPRGRGGGEFAQVGVEAEQDRTMSLKQIAGAVYDPLGENLGVERLGEDATDLGQRFRRPPTSFTLGEQTGVPHRDSRLSSQGLDHFSFLERRGSAGRLGLWRGIQSRRHAPGQLLF